MDNIEKAFWEWEKSFLTGGPSVLSAWRAGWKAALAWQPISTAPKDGTRILIWSAEIGTVLSVLWDPTWDIQYDEQNDILVDVGAWTDHAVESFGDEETKSYSPTHWKPLPELPKEAPNA